ncbi:MAG TPA: exodeoxyribonuclease III, partial [Acidiphilium sp.]
MKLATWNVNSVRTRSGLVADFLAREQPDLLLMQEIKCEAAQFPKDAFEPLGYRAEIVGQKSYNGVAILSREAVEPRRIALPGQEDDGKARYLEIGFRGLAIGNLYLPNGNSGGEDGYRTKLDWMANLRRHAASLLDSEQDFLLAGDYNVCPSDTDFAKGALGPDDALVRPETRAEFNA